jgi:2-methylcitrate dehydratase
LIDRAGVSLTSATIAAYASELSFDQITDEAVTAAERLTLDSLGCCLGAYTSPPSKRLRRLYGGVGSDDEPRATVLGAGTNTRIE